jgi:DNA-directed RNA polymerase specialized sigma24 family protein
MGFMQWLRGGRSVAEAESHDLACEDRELLAAVDAMPELVRRALLLRKRDGLSQAQIAVAMSLSGDEVEELLREAVLRLAAAFDESACEGNA